MTYYLLKVKVKYVASDITAETDEGGDNTQQSGGGSQQQGGGSGLEP